MSTDSEDAATEPADAADGSDSLPGEYDPDAVESKWERRRVE
jgi:hypothetical protein